MKIYYSWVFITTVCTVLQKKSSKLTCQSVKQKTDIEKFLVKIYYHYDYFSRRRNLVAECCAFCD